MELRNFRDCGAERRQIKQLFLEAFPPEERPPFWFLCSRAGRKIVDFSVAYDGDAMVGMSYVISDGAVAYLFFLAIKSEQRGRGYGRQLLAQLCERYKGVRLFLALEPPDERAENNSQRLRRHRFYESCGLRDLPCSITEASVVYDVMGIGGAVQPAEYNRLIDRYAGRLLRRLAGMRMTEK